MSKSYDIAIATSTYFAPYGNCVAGSYRVALFRELLKSLLQVDLRGRKACWVIHDDASPEFVEIPRMPFDVRILKIADNLGQPKAYFGALAEANKIAEWVIFCDSDGWMTPDCIERAFALSEKYPDAQMYGLYNSPYHKTIEEFEDHVLKESICEHGRFFRSSFGGWGVVENAIPVLRPSGIQHCGKFGLNGTEDDYDRELEIVRA